MKLENAHIKNFKLLEDIELEFSTDSKRPLTVIRAENGSGKTSILYALRWALYGSLGVPKDKRLTSAISPLGEPVTVQVSVEFSTTDPNTGEEVRHRLIRTCIETPEQDDRYSRGPEQLRLLQRTTDGAKEVTDGKEGLIGRLLPINLADVFFTDGDEVQSFVSSGHQADRERQNKVHDAIRKILGIDDVENASKDLARIAKRLKNELADDGGEELQKATRQAEQIDDQITEVEAALKKVQERIDSVTSAINQDDRELFNIRGHGDLDAIHARIKNLEEDLQRLDEQEKTIRIRMKELLKSEELSWHLIGHRLKDAISTLNELADRNVIPGASIEVLIDRLELGICICGEELEKGSDRSLYVQRLIAKQRATSPDVQRLSRLLHLARDSFSNHQGTTQSGQSFDDIADDLRHEYTMCRDTRRNKESDLSVERQKRLNIDQERVQILANRIESNKAKLSEFNRQYGRKENRLLELEEQLKLAKERQRKAEELATLNDTLLNHSIVASHLWDLAQSTFASLQSEYVRRVSDRMNELFLEIVGADPEAETAVFTSVKINEKYDIIIHTQDGKTLDADYELNGASKRALTLSFIWALMEVASREAPRIIDTPLGMTSGAVKRRMVEIVTDPITTTGVPYQVILLMTRSEIRDIEEVLDQRIGTIFTLSCSKDYPHDLLHDWSDGTPTVRTCSCSHRQICPICARRNDDRNRFKYREVSPI